VGAAAPHGFFLETVPAGAGQREGAGAGNSGPRVTGDWLKSLKFEDSICWAFGLVPSELDDLFERVSYRDLKTKIRLRAEEKTADTMQAFETLAIVVSKALGGGDKDSVENAAPAPQTADELERAMARVLG
jgi:hypothetical protein